MCLQKYNDNVPWRPAVQGFPRDHQAPEGPGDEQSMLKQMEVDIVRVSSYALR